MTFLVLCFIAVVVGSASLIYSLSIAALLFINVLFHIGGSIRLKGYNTSLITALLLYLPVSTYAYYYFWTIGTLTPLKFNIINNIGYILDDNGILISVPSNIH